MDVFPETMLKNMNRTYGLVYSQRLLLKLIDETSLSREAAYDMVQKLTAESWDKQKQFKDLVLNSSIIDYL